MNGIKATTFRGLLIDVLVQVAVQGFTISHESVWLRMHC